MTEPLEPLVVALAARARRGETAASLTEASRTLTLDAIVRAVRSEARWLAEQRVAPGDRVVMLAGNSIDFCVAYFAVHAAGAIAVPLGPDVSAGSLAQILEDCRPALILSDEPAKAPAGARPFPTLETLAAAPDSDEPRCRLDDPADLLFTTGTTGRRKGVLLTQANVAAAARNINAFVGATASDLEIVPIPLSHSFGLGRLRCWARVGHNLAVERGLRNPALLFKALVERRATGLALVPAGIALLRRLIGPRLADVAPHLRYLELGSAALAPDDRAFLLSTLPNTRICHHYGLTEASRSAFAELHGDAGKTGSAGRASPNVELRIVDEQGGSVAPGTVGAIVVRGEMVMREYWERPDLTSAVLHDGWLRTGDDGHLDADGYLYLLGRREDIINVGGLKVSPVDVENRLREIPGVRDAACIGVPDPRGVLGHVVKAFIVADDEPAALGIAARLQGVLPEHELPRLFERVSELPKTESGKLRRAELRARSSTS